MKKMKVFCAVLALVMLLSSLAGCSNCQHQWVLANCKDPQTCKLCGATEGDPTQDHEWEDATTDAPKTCSVCGLTEGEKIEVDERFTTKACKGLFGNWTVKYEIDGSDVWASEMTIEMRMTYRFTNEGDLIITTAPYDKASFEAEYTQYLINMVYSSHEAKGEDRAATDAYYMQTTGMSVQEFCKQQAPEVSAVLTSEEERVYYVADGLLYTGEDWGDTMSSRVFELTENGKLKIEDGDPDHPLEFTRTANVIK